MRCETVERRTVQAREAFEPVERVRVFEGFRIKPERHGRRIAPGASARSLLRRLRVGSRVGAEKEFCAARRGGRDECAPVRLAFQHWQAVTMWTQPAGEQRIA